MPPKSRVPRPHAISLRFGAARVFADAANDRAGWREVAAVMERDVRALAVS
jgi:hypothetical protein